MAQRTVYVGADHAGFHLKEELIPALLKQDFHVIDLSPDYAEGDDYPDVAFALAKSVAAEKDGRGILVCGSGVGMAMAANRIPGARAFDASDERTVEFARKDNNANILTLSGWHIASTKAKKLIALFFATPFSKAARHARRVKKLG